MKKVMVSVCAIVIAFLCCSCSLKDALFSLMFETHYPEENYKVFHWQRTTIYTFYENLALNLSSDDDKKDSLSVIFDEEPTRDILSGYFTDVGHNQDRLFIVMDDMYYVYDIQKCIDSDTESDYLLNKSDFESFVKLYPEYETYDWDF